MDVITKYLVIIEAILHTVSVPIPSEMFQPKQIYESFGRIGGYAYSLSRAAFFACAVKTV